MDIMPIIDRYYAAQPQLRALLLRHSKQVAERAVEICMAHPEWKADTAFVHEASMLHDIGIFLCHAPKIFCFGKEPYIRHGFLGGQLLREAGLPKHARVAERHTGSGLTVTQILRQNIQLPPKDWMPETIEEKVICYADKFFSKSNPDRIATSEQIRQQMEHFSPEALDNWLLLEQQMSS